MITLMDHPRFVSIVADAMATSRRLFAELDPADDETLDRAAAARESYRQALIALQAHQPPEPAELSVTRVCLEDAQAAEGDLFADPPARHAIQAMELFNRDRDVDPAITVAATGIVAGSRPTSVEEG